MLAVESDPITEKLTVKGAEELLMLSAVKLLQITEALVVGVGVLLDPPPEPVVGAGVLVDPLGVGVEVSVGEPGVGVGTSFIVNCRDCLLSMEF